MSDTVIKRPQSLQARPKDAQIVFKGILYDVYQWQQQRFDGTSVTYERLKRHNDSVVIIPVTEQGKILVMRERQPGTDWYTAVPCGGIDQGEAPDVAARRELREETGYEPAELELWFAHQVEHRTDWAIFVFIARGCRESATPDPGAGEQIETREVSFEEFLKIATQDDFQNINIAPKLLAAALDPQAMLALKKRFGL